MSAIDVEAILNQPFRWPKTGDKFFTASPRWEGNAYVDQYGHGRLVVAIRRGPQAGRQIPLMSERAHS